MLCPPHAVAVAVERHARRAVKAEGAMLSGYISLPSESTPRSDLSHGREVCLVACSKIYAAAIRFSSGHFVVRVLHSRDYFLKHKKSDSCSTLTCYNLYGGTLDTRQETVLPWPLSCARSESCCGHRT